MHVYDCMYARMFARIFVYLHTNIHTKIHRERQVNRKIVADQRRRMNQKRPYRNITIYIKIIKIIETEPHRVQFHRSVSWI